MEEETAELKRDNWFKWIGIAPDPSEPVTYSLAMDEGCEATVEEINELIDSVNNHIPAGQTVVIEIPDGEYGDM